MHHNILTIHPKYKYLLLYLSTANVELYSSVNEGRQFTCPGELVIFTCQVFGSNTLEWRSPLISPIKFSTTSMVSNIITKRPFQANLTLIGNSNVSEDSNITSTLEMIEPRDAVLVQCLSTQTNETESFTVTGKVT